MEAGLRTGGRHKDDFVVGVTLQAQGRTMLADVEKFVVREPGQRAVRHHNVVDVGKSRGEDEDEGSSVFKYKLRSAIS